MKSFSPAGLAIKGFFGLGARTFGNPAGAIFGNGAFGAASFAQWSRVDGGIFPADPVIQVTLADATHAFARTNTNLGITTDGIHWTHVNGPLVPGITSLGLAAGKPGGVYVMAAAAGAAAKLLRSADGGATWADVTPAASSPIGCVYSHTVGLFISCDSIAAAVYTSPDGLVWTSTAQSQVIDIAALFAENSVILTAQTVNPAGHPQFWSSVDGQHWTLRFTHPTFTAIFGTPNTSHIWCGPSGSIFASLMTDGVTVEIYTSFDGISWTRESANGANLNTPPFTSIAFQHNGALLTGFPATNFTDVAYSTSDGVSWLPIGINFYAPGLGGTALISDTGQYNVYSYGAGVLQSQNAFNWASVLPLAGGSPPNIVDLEAGQPNTRLHAVAVGNDVAGNGGIWVSPA